MNINTNYVTYYNMFYNALFTENKNKKIILEPISCIVKLILLNYKENGTKISILNNSIDFYEPSQFQGLLRNLNGDRREDLHNLYNPIIKSLEWYPPSEGEIYKDFYTKCKSGIEKLISSYDQESTISRTLELYCKLLTDSLESEDIEKGLNDSEKYPSPLLDRLKGFWKKEEIDLIYSLLQIIENSSNDIEKNTYIENVINTVSMKEKNLANFIETTTTTY